MVKAGEESPVQGLLEQWLREGKMDECEAVMASTSMFAAGVDSVSLRPMMPGTIMTATPHKSCFSSYSTIAI